MRTFVSWRVLRSPVISGLVLVLLSMGCRTQAVDGPRVGAVVQSTEEPLRVLSFNIRFDNPADGPNAWPHRREGVANLVRFYDVDVAGLQEAQRSQLDYLEAQLPGFAWFGLPRSTGDPGDEHSAVLYRTTRLELLDQATFWLSETPEVRGSKGWDAALPRIVTWGRFRDRATGEEFYLFNTHFDHRGEQARAESARLLRRAIADIAGDLPVLITGDFNADPTSEPYRIMTEGGAEPVLRDAYSTSIEPHYGPSSTWNAFKQIEPGRRIDFIFTGEDVRVQEHAILSETFEDGRFPSDHLPVLAVVEIR